MPSHVPKMAAPVLCRRPKQTAWWFSTVRARGFRSDAALEALAKAREDGIRNLILYNYPSFSGAFSALFAHLFHSHRRLPFLVLPYSSAVPLRVEDLYLEGLQRCYLLDFVGPRGFDAQISRQSMCEVIAFDHRKSAISRIPSPDDSEANVRYCVDLERSSSRAAYNYFANKLAEECELPDYKDNVAKLMNLEDEERVGAILSYIEDSDLLRWSLPDVRAFNIGFSEWRQRINCITNPYMFEELLELNAADLIAKGNSHISSRRDAATKLLDMVFKVRLGRGFYGECLGVRADGNSKLSELLGKELSVRSAAAGLRPIGAVVYMHRNNLKMCLRSTDASTDTSEVAKAYGGGGSSSSSSFMIRMDEYNQWLSTNSS